MITSLKNHVRSIDLWKWAVVWILLIINLAFRFVIPNDPEHGLVFDEAYFVSQAESYAVNTYFLDPHPPLGKMFMYFGLQLFNPDAAEILDPEPLGDKIDDGYTSPLNSLGVRFFPRVFGALLPVIGFLFLYELLGMGKSGQSILAKITPLLGGLMLTFDNALLLDSRYALLTPFVLFVMVFCMLAALWYYKYATNLRRKLLLFILVGVSIGMVAATKLVAVSVFPFVGLLILLREWKDLKDYMLWRRIAAALVNLGLAFYLGAIVYVGVFAWHFGMIQHFSPDADDISIEFQEDLKNGTHNVAFWTKLVEWQGISAEYQEHVPVLDYTKPDEIGSMWVTWPIMARPINYYRETLGNGQIRFLYSVGNPVVWSLGLIGILALSGIVVARAFGKNATQWRHVLIIGLYFSSWLPFALITRVMYFYHYYPALVFSILAWIMLLNDFILPRVTQLSTYLREMKLNSPAKLLAIKNRIPSTDTFWGIAVFLILLVLVMLGFYIYAPFTYMIPINQEQFESRILMKEWNMRWPD